MDGVSDDVLGYWSEPGRFTALGSIDHAIGSDVADVVAAVQGLLIYDTVAEPFYGVTLSPSQAATIHERFVDRLLATACAVDDRPLGEARPPEARVGARCHVYSRVTVALLRAAGVPARARCGFGAYFRQGWFEDHWVAEFWDASEGCWRMVDAQLDSTWRERISFTGDPFALTPGEFVTAGHAWQAWRRGELDAGRCGLSAIDEFGSFWIAGNLRLDLASLNKVEMNPWDVWGSGWEPGEEPTAEQLDLFDAVAELTVDPDARFAELRERYETDDRLRMDGTIFNANHRSTETVA